MPIVVANVLRMPHLVYDHFVGWPDVGRSGAPVQPTYPEFNKLIE